MVWVFYSFGKFLDKFSGILLIILWFLFVGYVGKFSHSGSIMPWVLGTIIFIVFFGILIFIGYNHKPQKLIEEDMLEDLSIDELRKINDNLKEENERVKNGEMPKQVKQILDDWIEQKQKDTTISEIENLKLKMKL